ncbi:MAG: glycoside hydrolase family 16 protein [Gemmatimonadales bacterium]
MALIPYRPPGFRAALGIGFALILAACGSSSTIPGVVPPPPPPSSAPPAEWTLVWSDDFTGPAGSAVDGTKWVAETGGQGWGNQEKEYYTSGTANAALDGDGKLVITARAEPANSSLSCWYGACKYTSARLLTKAKFEPTYGRFEARIKIPGGQGIWPAFWMLGANIDGVGWPRCGEIDIMENIGREPNMVHGTVHGPGYSGGSGISASYQLATESFADGYHVFVVEWTAGEIRWLVDDKEYSRTTTASLPVGASWVFDHPFFLIMNVAVGGAWPGDPDGSTIFPQQMLVDYVRVYKR